MKANFEKPYEVTADVARENVRISRMSKVEIVEEYLHEEIDPNEKRIFKKGDIRAYFIDYSKGNSSQVYSSIVINTDKACKADPFTYNDLEELIKNKFVGYEVVQVIGTKKFWLEYCKPVPEEKRIFDKNDYVLTYRSEIGYWYFENKNYYKATPFTKKELYKIVEEKLVDTVRDTVEAFGGVEWLWKQSTPVKEENKND